LRRYAQKRKRAKTNSKQENGRRKKKK